MMSDIYWKNKLVLKWCPNLYQSLKSLKSPSLSGKEKTMTYGVYSRDLAGCSIKDLHSIEDAKKYCRQEYVVCSEKIKKSGWTISFSFHKWTRMHFRSWRWYGIELGFVTIFYKRDKYKWADKIVYDPQKEK